jgi:hypothetical protein
VDAFTLMNVVQGPAELPIGVSVAFLLGQRDVLLPNRADQPLGIAVLCRLAHCRHADPAADGSQEAHIAIVGVLDALSGWNSQTSCSMSLETQY